ncbi:MAG: hypothetical protein JSW71_00775 [Gemmatimonadota bacterium]|nr:MAG: hypothetical protein JSW71_00775 [Gemmatimonadota bacterium]
MKRPHLFPVAALAVFLTFIACGERQVSVQGSASYQAIPDRLPDWEFARLVEGLSEPRGFFDTDNLISNETSYLHVIDRLRESRVRGGVYLGVGPGQNFSYIAEIRPRLAFIIDIRRDNLLQHLLYKALFALSHTRVEYLCLLTGRPAPHDAESWRGRPVRDLVEYVDAHSVDVDYLDRAWQAVIDRIMTFGLTLSETDIATVARFHQAFVDAGLSLRFHSYNRPPRPDYPTLRELLLQTDRAGNHANYLADEDDYRFLRSLENRNLVVPVVGDLAGPHALDALGRYIAGRGESVSAFYTSNVEFYLMRQGTFKRFAENVRGLPIDQRSVIIRSYFNRGYSRTLPGYVPGHSSTQLIQSVSEFLQAHDNGWYRTYWDLVTSGGGW